MSTFIGPDVVGETGGGMAAPKTARTATTADTDANGLGGWHEGEWRANQRQAAVEQPCQDRATDTTQHNRSSDAPPARPWLRGAATCTKGELTSA